MIVALVMVSLGYAQCSPDLFGGSHPMLRPWQLASFNIGDALYILAIVLFFSGVSRPVVVLDMLQAILLAVLRFTLTYNPATRTHFASNHLLITQLVAFFLFAIALVAGLGAASAGERRFLRLLSCFFGLRFVGYFLSDQVSFIWLHNYYCSLWDAPGTILYAGFALYLYRFASTEDATSHRAATPHQPSLLVRSLMPSFLALANLTLGLFVLQVSSPKAALVISLTVVLYVARTALMQRNAALESAQLRLRNEQLEALATHDALTGIGNRRSLAAAYAQIQATDCGKALGMILVDIDYFKQANDLLGHLYGDKILIALAETLQGASEHIEGCHCARFGGDEFALLAPGISREQTVLLAEEVRSRFAARAFQVGAYRVSVSLGLHCEEAANNLPLEAMISCADAALYRAKLHGRNRVDGHSTQEHEALIRNIEPDSSFQLQHAG